MAVSWLWSVSHCVNSSLFLDDLFTFHFIEDILTIITTISNDSTWKETKWKCNANNMKTTMKILKKKMKQRNDTKMITKNKESDLLWLLHIGNDMALACATPLSTSTIDIDASCVAQSTLIPFILLAGWFCRLTFFASFDFLFFFFFCSHLFLHCEFWRYRDQYKPSRQVNNSI